MATSADTQALWDAYLAAAMNQDKADRSFERAVSELAIAQLTAKSMERYADDAYEAWENAQ